MAPLEECNTFLGMRLTWARRHNVRKNWGKKIQRQPLFTPHTGKACISENPFFSGQNSAHSVHALSVFINQCCVCALTYLDSPAPAYPYTTPTCGQQTHWSKENYINNNYLFFVFNVDTIVIIAAAAAAAIVLIMVARHYFYLALSWTN